MAALHCRSAAKNNKRKPFYTMSCITSLLIWILYIGTYDLEIKHSASQNVLEIFQFKSLCPQCKFFQISKKWARDEEQAQQKKMERNVTRLRLFIEKNTQRKQS